MQATANFICWLGARLVQVQKEFRDMVSVLRLRFRHPHPRTNDVHAQLIATYSVFVRFLLDAEAIDEAEADALQRRVGTALEKAAKAQAQFSNKADPCLRFVELLSSAIASGAAHLAGRDGASPTEREAACGWRSKTLGTGENERSEWQPQGSRIGWIEGDDVYLDLASSYRAAQSMATDGCGVEVSSTTLARRLRDEHLLVSTDKARETLTVRRMLEGRKQEVLHLHAKLLSL